MEQTAQQHIFHHQSFAEGNSPPLLHFFLMFTDRKANGLCRTGTEASWGQTTKPTSLAKGSRGSTCAQVLSVNHGTGVWDGQKVVQLQPEPCMVGTSCGAARGGVARDGHCACHVNTARSVPQAHALLQVYDSQAQQGGTARLVCGLCCVCHLIHQPVP